MARDLTGNPPTPRTSRTPPTLRYATFWQRSVALTLDALILLPLTLLDFWLQSVSHRAAVLDVVPVAVAWCAYTIYFHARSGQTPGKRFTGIRVVRRDGTRIGWNEAWRRSAVEVVLAALSAAGTLLALSAYPAAQYNSADWLERTLRLMSLKPGWLGWSDTTAQIWSGSELLVMLMNRERRSLHDFLGGTVVVQVAPASSP